MTAKVGLRGSDKIFNKGMISGDRAIRNGRM